MCIKISICYAIKWGKIWYHLNSKESFFFFLSHDKRIIRNFVQYIEGLLYCLKEISVQYMLKIICLSKRFSDIFQNVPYHQEFLFFFLKKKKLGANLFVPILFLRDFKFLLSLFHAVMFYDLRLYLFKMLHKYSCSLLFMNVLYLRLLSISYFCCYWCAISFLKNIFHIKWLKIKTTVSKSLLVMFSFSYATLTLKPFNEHSIANTFNSSHQG